MTVALDDQIAEIERVTKLSRSLSVAIAVRAEYLTAILLSLRAFQKQTDALKGIARMGEEADSLYGWAVADAAREALETP